MRLACSSRFSRSLRSLRSLLSATTTLPQGSVPDGLHFHLVLCRREYRDLPVKLPKFYILIDGQRSGLLNCLSVVRADQWDRLREVSILIDQVSAIVGHGMYPSLSEPEARFGRNVKQVNIVQ